MSGASIHQVRDRYLDLLERSILNMIYGESPLETRVLGLLQRLRHPYLTRRGAIPWPSRAHSMIGHARMRNVRELVDAALDAALEAGAWAWAEDASTAAARTAIPK